MPVSAASQDVLLRSLWLPASSGWADPPDFSSLWPVCGPSRPSTPPSGQGLIPTRAADLGFLVGAGEGNRTLMTSLEGRYPYIRASSAEICAGGAGVVHVSYRD